MTTFATQTAYHDVFFRHFVTPTDDLRFEWHRLSYSFFRVHERTWSVASSLRNPYLFLPNHYPCLATPTETEQFLSDLLEHFSAYSAIRLDPFPTRGIKFRHLTDALKKLRIPYQVQPTLIIPVIENVSGVHGSSLFRQKLRRKERRLQEETGCGGEVISRFDPEQITNIFSVEAKGWKGKDGTAVTRDATAYSFFLDLAKTAGERNELKIFTLRSTAHEVLVFHFCIQSGTTLSLVKTGYDEEYHKHSPGMILTFQVLEWMQAQKLTALDFFGPTMDWHRQFDPRLDEYVTLTIGQRNLRSRLYLGYRALRVLLMTRHQSNESKLRKRIL